MTTLNEIAPHVCPLCGSACYMGAAVIQCVNDTCYHHHAETAAYYHGRQRDIIDVVDGGPDWKVVADQWVDASSAVGLDVWGSVFGVPRNPGEPDAEYRQRLNDMLKQPPNPVAKVGKRRTPDEQAKAIATAKASAKWVDMMARARADLLDAWPNGADAFDGFDNAHIVSVDHHRSYHGGDTVEIKITLTKSYKPTDG